MSGQDALRQELDRQWRAAVVDLAGAEDDGEPWTVLTARARVVDLEEVARRHGVRLGQAGT